MVEIIHPLAVLLNRYSREIDAEVRGDGYQKAYLEHLIGWGVGRSLSLLYADTITSRVC